MKDFYQQNSIKIITGILALVLIGMYIGLTIFTGNAHLTNPIYTRPLVEKIEIKNFIGTIELSTSEVEGFRLEYTNRKPDDRAAYYPLFKMGTPTIATLDGRFSPIENCDLKHDEDSVLQSTKITEEGGKSYQISDYPIIKITAKHDIILDVRRSHIFGFAGNISAVKFINVNCSSFIIGKIADAAEFDLRGDSTIITDDISGDFSLKSTNENGGENVLILQNILGNALMTLDGNTRLYAAEISGNLVKAETGDNVVAIDNVLGNSTEN